MKLNQAISNACKQSNCRMLYVVELDGDYYVCTEPELYDKYDQAQVIGCAFNGKWEG